MQTACTTCESICGASGAILARVPIAWDVPRQGTSRVSQACRERLEEIQLACGLWQQPHTTADHGIRVSGIGDSVG